MKLYNKRILFLGGSANMVDLVLKAKELGIVTYVIDWYTENKSIAKKCSDFSFDISIADIDRILKLIEDEKIDGVITGFTDSYLPYYVEICNKAQLPCYIDKSQLKYTLDKREFKKVCIKEEIPTIKQFNYSDVFHDRIKYPIIIKPIDASGSRGVIRVDNVNDFPEKYNETLLFSNSKEVIIEQFVDWHHFNTYYTLSGGKAYLSATADRYVSYENESLAPLPIGLMHPSIYTEKYMQTTNKQVISFLEKYGFSDGVVFIQGFTNGQDFLMYEMGQRLNGGSTYVLINECMGYNQVEQLINFSVYGEMGSDNLLRSSSPFFNKLAFTLPISLKQGTVMKISGLEKIRKNKNIVNVIQLVSTGDEINLKKSHGKLFGYFLIVTETRDELLDIINLIDAELKVLDENGNNLINEIIDIKKHWRGKQK